MLHKEVVTGAEFDENSAEERQNYRVGFFFPPLKMFFVKQKPLQEMTWWGTPLLGAFSLGVCVSFEMGLEWDNVCACWLQLWLPLSAQSELQ